MTVEAKMTVEQKIKELEKQFQLSYKKNTRLSVMYLDEKLQMALENLVVSKGNLRERIWYTYKYYFSNFFKRMVGTSPLEYKKQQTQKE